MNLALDDGDLNKCVSCGLCLPACPTWRVTGHEIASPRGRIAAMRAVQWDHAPIDDAFERAMEQCVQCRACEPVCPAFVPFGHLMEGARETLATRPRSGRPLRRALEWLGLNLVLPRRRVLAVVTWILWLLQRLHVGPARRSAPPLRAKSIARPLRPSTVAGENVYLFPGCVMDAWLRDTHRAAQRVIEAAGGSMRLPDNGAACCGALHQHSGRTRAARRLANDVLRAFPGDAPVLVDSAGCGAAMKEYGRLLGTEPARAFSARVVDVHEWLAGREIRGLRATGRSVVVQDPCHLRHVQRRDGLVRDVLSRSYRVTETDDDGLCCGAGGLYALVQPDLAARIRSRKIDALRRVGGDDPAVASANPGCILHLTAGGLRVRHPLEYLSDALEENRHARTHR